MKNELISIITPVYNCEKILSETIESVLCQTYKNWELLLVDDCSTDNSVKIIQKYVKKDKRIKFIQLENNSGAAVARNVALINSKGRFVAYLDSDDMWKKEKLDKQIQYMLKNKYAFSCTDYEKIDENGKSLNKTIKLPDKVDYNLFLRNTIIQTVGVMVDTKKTGKEILKMPNIRRRQDAATWCQILKNGFDCYRVPESLSYYRVVHNSLSSNKFKAMRGTWNLYRKIEKLSFIKSCYCFVGYAFNAVKKRIYKKNSKKMNVLYIATIAKKRNRLDGETIKCRLLEEYLRNVEKINVVTVDTDDWKRHVLKLTISIIINYFRCDKIVVSAADRGSHIVLSFFNKIKCKKPIYYFVIGGSLYNNIVKNNWNCNDYNKLDGIYVEASSLKENLAKINILNVEVVNNFRKVENFKNSYKKEKYVKFLFFGRIIKEKGIEEAIKLINRLNKEKINCTLDIYGQIQEEYLIKLKTMFTSKIAFHGEIKPDGKTEYEILSNYDIFILPTEYPGECLPGALIDAYISGLSVLVSNWQYAKEYVKEGINGEIFEYQNYDDMYFKAKKMINNKLIDKYKKESLKLADNYKIEKILKKFDDKLLS